MAASSRHDAWSSGDAYDLYMGRWSRPVAARFVDWLALPAGLSWLEMGAGTGALTEAILATAEPSEVLAVEPSAAFLARARERLPDRRVEFRLGDAASLATLPGGSRDVAVGGLVLNFIPERVAALAEMARIVRPDGTVGFYVWDYPGGGMGVMRAFWTAAAELDPAARDLTEDRRFPFCTSDGLREIVEDAGLAEPEVTEIVQRAVFADFDDFWRPFTLGAGPAPGYCASLSPEARERLRQTLSESLARQADGSVVLPTRAWAVKAVVA
jgi:ubiquinone/menaquinone biosynthesis C-methylase UbiE